MTDHNLENINEIDMNCNIVDDDDSFSVIDDGRELNQKTGIMIDLSDDEPLEQIIKCDTNIRDANIKTSKSLPNINLDNVSSYNEIDLETTSYDDEDEDLMYRLKSNSNEYYEEDDNIGLVDEDLLAESKKRIRKNKDDLSTSGDVEANYWKKISQKHAKSNKRGAYSSSFHFSGDPEKERDIFNHMMKANTSDASELNAMISNSSDSNFDSIGDFGSISGESSFGGEGGSCSESLDANNTCSYYSAILENLFELLGFDVFANSNTTYSAIDICDMVPPIYADSLIDLISELEPIIIDCVIYPLQTMTGESFETAAEWVEWYNSETGAEYPECSSYIEYCDVLANHLNECVI